MKAISLWQPWATLWVLQIKKFETRSWPFPVWYTGQVAIHAAQKKMRFFSDYLPDWQVEGINQALCIGGLIYEELPYGAFIGICDGIKSKRIDRHPETDLELELGDWSHGRHYWVPTNMRALPDPIPYPGRQKVFNVEDHIIFGGQPKPKQEQIRLF